MINETCRRLRDQAITAGSQKQKQPFDDHPESSSWFIPSARPGLRHSPTPQPRVPPTTAGAKISVTSRQLNPVQSAE